MADKTQIEWTDATWNPITGCSVVSPGCTNCYAMTLAGTRLRNHPSRQGLARDSKAGPVWTGEVRLNEQWLTQPLLWKRPRRIFVCAHGDLFHEAVPDEWIDKVFAVMALAPQHTFQVLTKRARRMRQYLSEERRPYRIARAVADFFIATPPRYTSPLIEAGSWPIKSEGDPDDPSDITLKIWPLLNAWLGVSAEDQQRADERIPDLLATPAAVRWASAEPLLGPIDFTNLDVTSLWDSTASLDALRGEVFMPGNAGQSSQTFTKPHLDWIVVGGESGSGARPMHPNWARSIRDQCQAAGVAFHFKQWGVWAPCTHNGEHASSEHVFTDGQAMLPMTKARSGRLLDGRPWDEYPMETPRPA